MAKLPKGVVKILLGDFNSQTDKDLKHKKTVGEYPPHKLTNKNGTRLIELCQRTIWKLCRPYFWNSLENKYHTTITKKFTMSKYADVQTLIQIIIYQESILNSPPKENSTGKRLQKVKKELGLV